MTNESERLGFDKISSGQDLGYLWWMSREGGTCGYECDIDRANALDLRGPSRAVLQLRLDTLVSLCFVIST